MTTIRVSSALSKKIEEKKNLHGFKSKEATIAFALSLLKSKDELIRETLSELKNHLKPLGASKIYYDIEGKVEDLLEDPFKALLREQLVEHIQKVDSSIKQSDFKIICRDLHIPVKQWKDYALAFQIEWED